MLCLIWGNFVHPKNENEKIQKKIIIQTPHQTLLLWSQ